MSLTALNTLEDLATYLNNYYLNSNYIVTRFQHVITGSNLVRLTGDDKELYALSLPNHSVTCKLSYDTPIEDVCTLWGLIISVRITVEELNLINLTQQLYLPAERLNLEEELPF